MKGQKSLMFLKTTKERNKARYQWIAPSHPLSPEIIWLSGGSSWQVSRGQSHQDVDCLGLYLGLLGHRRTQGAECTLSEMAPFPDMSLSQQEHETDQLVELIPKQLSTQQAFWMLAWWQGKWVMFFLFHLSPWISSLICTSSSGFVFIRFCHCYFVSKD